MTIFVANLNFRTTEQQLEELFSPYGDIRSVKIITDVYSGRSRGFAFVRMASGTEAQEAIRQLNNVSLDNNQLSVHEARPRTGNSLLKNIR